MFSCNVTLLNHNLVNERLLIVRNWGNYTMNELIYKAVFQSFFEVLVSACKINGFRERLFCSLQFQPLARATPKHRSVLAQCLLRKSYHIALGLPIFALQLFIQPCATHHKP